MSKGLVNHRIEMSEHHDQRLRVPRTFPLSPLRYRVLQRLPLPVNGIRARARQYGTSVEPQWWVGQFAS